MPSRVLSSAAPMMAGAPTDEELGLGSSRAAPHVAVGMPSVVVTQSPPHTGTQAQQLAAATGGTFSTLNPIHTAAVADDASGTAVYRLLAFLCAPAGVLDDCASCPRYVTWLIPWEALTFLLLASVFTAMVIRGTLGVGALFIPIILHRFIRLLLDVGMIICGIGPWSQAQNSGTMHSGVWLPRLMRLADGMGAGVYMCSSALSASSAMLTRCVLLLAGLTTLMASFLIAGSNIHAAVPTAGAGTPGRGRPAMALYKTLLFPMFLVCAAQLLVVVPTLIGYTACRLGLLSTSPGPLFGLVYTPRWRKAFSALAVQLCLLLLNAGTLPLCLKLDDYSSVSWGTVLVIPSLLVGLGLGCCALVTIGACTDYAVSAGRCGRRMRSAAVTATPWTVCKTLFAVFSISTACVSLMGLGSLLIRVSAELEKAEAVYLNPSNAGITSFLLLEGGTQSLVIPWCLSYGVACLGLWLVCTRILPAWRREFAHALGTLTPTSYARATQAALGQAWMGAEGGAGGVGQAGGSDSGSLHVRTLFLPVPSKLVRVGFTRYRRVRSLTSTAEQAQGGSSGSVALDDCQALSRGCAAADAEDDYKTWLTKAQLLLEARAGAKNAGADKKGHMQMNELKNASYDGSNGGEEMCIEMVSLPMPVPCRPLSAGAPERGPTGLEGHMDGERGDEGITVRMRRQGTSHVEAQSAEAAKPAAAEQAGEGLGVGHPFGSDPHTMQELQPLSPGPGQLPARAGFFASLRSPASADLRSLVSPGGTTTAAMNLSSGGGSGWASTGLGIGAAAIAAGSAAGTALPAWLSPRRARKGPTAAHKRTDEEEAAGAMDGLGGTTDCTAPAQTGNRTRSIGGALSGIIQALSPRVQSLAAAVGWPSVGPAAAAAWPCASTEGELESCLEAYVREAQEACECALCCEREIDTVLLECGHALCWCCAQKLPAHVASNTRRCPFCRTPISYAARLMLPDSLLAAALADPSAVAENHADSSSILEPEQLQHRLSCLHAVMSCHAVKLPRSDRKSVV